MMLHHLFLALKDEPSLDIFLWMSFVCLRLSFDHECDLEP